MSNIYQKLRLSLIEAVEKRFDLNATNYNFSIESPKNSKNGDLSANIAMILCKSLKENPKHVAGEIVSWMKENTEYKSIEVAGPGFINFFLTSKQLYDALLLAQKNETYEINLAALSNERSKKVNLEFASPNPTGPMHIGHARGAIYGQVLANILVKCGYEVDREYYINDAGNQIDLLALSVIARVREVCGIEFRIPEGGYPGEYVLDIAKKTIEKFGREKLLKTEKEIISDASFFEKLKEFIVGQVMKVIKLDLLKIGVAHNTFVSEKNDVLAKGMIQKGIGALEEKGIVYEGFLEPPKGKKDKDWKPRKQKLFGSTEYGDDADRPLFKPDGSHTYFAGDIGYHYHKIVREYDKMFLALGADHSGYVKRISGCVKALAPDVEFKVLLFQLVKFMKGGKPYKMSKRAGNFISVDDVLREIDADSLKFLMLNSKNDTTLVIDFEEARNQSKDNPVFYVQYAHARCCSLMRKFDLNGLLNQKEVGVEVKSNLNYEFNAHEKDLIKLIHSFTRVIVSAADSFEPIKLINYLIDIASKFHSLWNLSGYYFIDDEMDKDAQEIRMLLVKGVLNAIRKALILLDIEGLKEM